ncbi:MAG: hypothetical protein AAF628_22595 [Planctomycetota bacterium]
MPLKKSAAGTRELFAQMQYLNLAEMRTFCQEHNLSLYIHVAKAGGGLRRTGDRDRKDVVLRRIFDFAVHGRRTGPTTYDAAVVADGPLPASLTARTRVRYGQYEKHNPAFVDALRRLTDGAFRTGMIARLVLRDFWTAGQAPTMRQLADAWLEAKAAHKKPRPEGAYLVDRWKGEAGPGWKQHRTQQARAALTELARLTRD